MQRRYEFFDLFVALGLFATIVAGGAFFLAANGIFSLSSSLLAERTPSNEMSNGRQWLQPALGQAILDQNLLEFQHEKRAPAAIARLDRVTDEYLRWQNSPFGYLETIKTSALRANADHHARIQTVMGRAIMQFTQRGVRAGLLPSLETDRDFNLRMIDKVGAMGRAMDAQFVVDWQPSLGRAIVTASQDQAKMLTLRQERLGTAIMQLVSAKVLYEADRAAIQEQLGGAIVVAIQSQSQATPAGHEPPVDGQVGTKGSLDVWPEIPMASIVVASLMLMSLFWAGLLVAPRLPEVQADDLAQVGSGALV